MTKKACKVCGSTEGTVTITVGLKETTFCDKHFHEKMDQMQRKGGFPMKFAATIIDVHPKKKKPEDAGEIEIKLSATYNSELLGRLTPNLAQTVHVEIQPIQLTMGEKPE